MQRDSQSQLLLQATKGHWYRDLLKWDFELALADLLDQVVWVGAVDGAANWLGSSEDLTDGSAQVTGTGSWAHDTGNLDDIVQGDVTVVLD